MLIFKNKIQSGFTLVELLLATALFSFILLFFVAGFIQVLRGYQKGVTAKHVHESARIILEDVASTMISAGGAGNTPIICDPDSSPCATGGRLCIGNVRYAWNEGAHTDYDPLVHPTQATGHGHEGFAIGGNAVLMDRDDFSFAKATDGQPCGAPFGWNYSDDLLDLRVAVQNFSVTPEPAPSSGLYKLELTVSSNTLDLLTSDADAAAECQIASGAQYCDTITLTTYVSLRQ